MHEMLIRAGEVALPLDKNTDERGFWLGCVGIRRDGALVSAKNGAVMSTAVDNYQLIPSSHAEGRVIRKLGKGGTIFVARISKKTSNYAMARPCIMCQIRLRSAKVERVFYTINEDQYGVWYPNSDTDYVY